MAINWQAFWESLNERQQAYLAAIYVIEEGKAVYFESLAYAQHPKRKGGEWRWIRYHTKDTQQGLDGRIGRLGLRDPGTGSTWDALSERGYVERRWEAGERVSAWNKYHDLDHLSVRLTTKGRKLIRENLGTVSFLSDEFLQRLEDAENERRRSGEV